jgi:hypothetical protein
MKFYLFLGIILLGTYHSNAQTINGTVNWGSDFRSETSDGGKTILQWPCETCIFSDEHPGWPLIGIEVPVSSFGELKCVISADKWEPISIPSNIKPETLPERYSLRSNIAGSRGKYKGFVTFPAVRKTSSGNWERMTSYTLQANFIPKPITANRTGWTTKSVLSTGQNFKIAINNDGIYKLDYNYFKNTLGLDPGSINPKQVKIYGNPGGMLPTLNSIERPDDLLENAVYFFGEDDGKFDPGDYILFYANGANETKFNPQTKLMTQEVNLYSAKNYYFVQISGGDGKRVSQNNQTFNPEYWTNKFLDVKKA